MGTGPQMTQVQGDESGIQPTQSNMQLLLEALPAPPYAAPTRPRGEGLRTALIVLFAFAAAYNIVTILHECGHAINTLLTGGDPYHIEATIFTGRLHTLYVPNELATYLGGFIWAVSVPLIILTFPIAFRRRVSLAVVLLALTAFARSGCYLVMGTVLRYGDPIYIHGPYLYPCTLFFAGIFLFLLCIPVAYLLGGAIGPNEKPRRFLRALALLSLPIALYSLVAYDWVAASYRSLVIPRLAWVGVGCLLLAVLSLPLRRKHSVSKRLRRLGVEVRPIRPSWKHVGLYGAVFGAVVALQYLVFAPLPAEAEIGEGDWLWYNKDYDGALGKYTEAIEKAPTNIFTYLARGHAYTALEKYDKAIADFSEVIRLRPRSPVGYFKRAQGHYLSGAPKAALDDINTVLALAAEYEGAYALKAGICLNLKLYDQAISDATEAIRRKHGDLWIYWVRAQAHEGKGDRQSALGDYSEVIRMDSMQRLAHTRRGGLYRRMRKYAAAIKDFTRAIELDEEEHWAWYCRGVCYFDTGKYAEAIADFERTIELEPEYKYGHVMLFLARKRAGGDGQKELAAFAEALKDGADWIAPVVKMLAGRITPSECLTAAEDKDEEKNKSKLCEAYYFIGQLHLIRREARAATECFEKCLATGQTLYLEYTGAEAELERLNNQQATSRPQG